MVRSGSSAAASTDSTSGHVAAPSPPTHDFAFFEWDYRPAPSGIPSDGGGDAAAACDGHAQEHHHHHQHLAVEPAVVTKNSIEDLMQPSIYKSLLSREMGGSTDLEPEIFESVPKDVIELDDHQAVGLGHVGTSRSALLQREFAESRLRRTAPGALLQAQLSGKPSSRLLHKKQPVGRRATHHGVMNRTAGGGGGSGPIRSLHKGGAASRWAAPSQGEDEDNNFEVGVRADEDDDDEDATGTYSGVLHSHRPESGQTLESPVHHHHQRSHTSEVPGPSTLMGASGRRSSDMDEAGSAAAAAHPATPGLSVQRLLSKLSLKRKK